VIGDFMCIKENWKASNFESVKMPDWYEERWNNRNTVLWGRSCTDELLFLTSGAYGHITVRAIYGKKEMTFIVLEGVLPHAGPFLTNILGSDLCSYLEVSKHDECEPDEDYHRAQLICCVTDIEIIRQHISDLTIRSPDKMGYILCRVLIKGKIEWFWKGQEECAE
jgi:hypothetical protein